MIAANPLPTAFGALLTVLCGCKSATPSFGEADGGADGGGDGGGSHAEGATWSGLEIDSGFGAAVALSRGVLWVGAPFGDLGALLKIDQAEPVVVASGDGRLGAAVAASGETVVAGAPLAGEIYDQEGVLVSGGVDGLGLALAGGSAWVAASGTGWTASTGATQTTSSRPTSIAWTGDTPSAETVAIGFARGETSMALAGQTLERPEARDEAGYALAAGDFDGDGQAEWALGAPGSNSVHIVGSGDAGLEVVAVVTGQGGRFGHALAAGDIDGDGTDDLLVGAPMSGALVTGAAFLYTGADWTAPSASWEGEIDDGQLGFSVAIEAPLVAIGAPGGATSLGRVVVAVP